MIDYRTEQKKKMAAWWQSPLGQCVLDLEQSCLQNNASHFFGQVQFQLGVNRSLLPQHSRPSLQQYVAESGDINACAEALPMKLHSVDTLLLSHVLEFSSEPHQVLREAERVLGPDGTLVLCQFNPWSLWGIRRLMSFQDNPPWQGQFYGLSRLKDWLELLNFDVVKVDRLMFRPPLNSAHWLNRFGLFERLGKRIWPIFSGVVVVVASKRTVPLTPIKSGWQSKNLFPTGRLANKPIIREQSDG
jgi:SAM-dependent methyltransferase